MRCPRLLCSVCMCVQENHRCAALRCLALLLSVCVFRRITGALRCSLFVCAGGFGCAVVGGAIGRCLPPCLSPSVGALHHKTSANNTTTKYRPTDRNHTTPTTRRRRRGSPLVDRLLAAGADVNVMDHSETTPLLHVVQHKGNWYARALRVFVRFFGCGRALPFLPPSLLQTLTKHSLPPTRPPST